MNSSACRHLLVWWGVAEENFNAERPAFSTLGGATLGGAGEPSSKHPTPAAAAAGGAACLTASAHSCMATSQSLSSTLASSTDSSAAATGRRTASEPTVESSRGVSQNRSCHPAPVGASRTTQ
eukprot:2144780-Rhodomonas_salina.1